MTNWIWLRREAKLMTVGCGLAVTMLGCATARSMPMRPQRVKLQSACLAESPAAPSDTDEQGVASLAVSDEEHPNVASDEVLVSDFGGRR